MSSLIFATLAGANSITCPIPVPTETEAPSYILLLGLFTQRRGAR